jgi:phage tail sheath gpL-like
VTISFNEVPSNLRVPLVAVEINNSRAVQGPALLAYRVLLLGQKTSAGSATADTLHRVTTADAVATLAGRGSLLHRMALAYFTNNTSTETWVGVLADDGAGVAATGTLTFTGPTTAAGTLALYVAGVRVAVGVSSGQTAAQVATATAAAINANTNLPVTAAVGGSGSEHVVTWTAKNKGETGNDINVRVNYREGESTPAGLGVALVAGSGGATNPDLADVLAAIGDEWFHVVTHPYTDSGSLDAIEAEMADRFSATRMIDGVAITSASGTQAELATLGEGRNSPHSQIIAQPGDNHVTHPAEYAAAVAGVVAYYAQIDPARPFQTLTVRGVLPPAEADLFTRTERNLLLFDGISTTVLGAGGVIQLERMITTYQLNAAGQDDTSYLSAETMFSLLYLRYSFRARWTSRYPRHKLADDGARIGAGQAVVTPGIGKAEAFTWFREMEDLGLVEDFDAFKAGLVVERNASNPNRLDFLLPPNLINQLVGVGASLQFVL